MPDSMHTVKDAVEHIFKLIIGKEDSVKVRKAEIELGRFGITSPVIEKKKGSKGSDDCGVALMTVVSHFDTLTRKLR